MYENIKKVAVIGAGQMGNGIAQVFATYGFTVSLIDVSTKQLDVAKSAISGSLKKLESKGRLKDSADSIYSRITFEPSISGCKDSQLVIEAIIENEQIKREVFQEVDQVVDKNTILASNTSSISITRLGSYVSNPERFIGMHFMNPVPIMKLVEIIPGIATSPEVTETIQKLTLALEKESSTSRDFPGFVVNRILMPMINEAFDALKEGVATAEDIDKGMKLGTNQPMGPLTLADFIGLDTCLAIMRVLHDGLGEPRYRPSPLLVQYVDAGWLGRKKGRGVYQY